MPPAAEAEAVERALTEAAEGFRRQHPALVFGAWSLGVHEAGSWRYVRLALRVWPGQQTLVEGPLQQRIVAALQTLDAGATAWMVTVTYREANDQPAPAS